MRTTAFFGLIFVLASCAHKSDCECGSTTPVEEVAQAQSQPTPEAETTAVAEVVEERTEAPEATAGTSTTEVSTEQCPVVEASTQTVTTSTTPDVPTSAAASEMISIDASLVSVSGNLVTIQDDQFTQLVLLCTGTEYTEVTINIVLRRAYVAPSLVQAGCRDFYFRTASSTRSQTFHLPE